MARKPLMAGNWKMNNTYAEAVVLAQTISNNFDKHWTDSVDVLVCPPSIDLKPVNTVFEFDHQPIQIGAQNVYWEPKGAFTGEVSVPMLKDVHCTCSIVGHSERRGYFGETNEDVNRKVRALLDGGLYAVACVGESLSVRDEGGAEEFVCAQVRAAFAGLEPEEAGKCVVAYEPIWAIGTGRTATDEQAQEVCFNIRENLRAQYGALVSRKVCILYGGSMNAKNCAGLLAQPDIDGGLIGGASLKVDDFAAIIREGCREE